MESCTIATRSFASSCLSVPTYSVPRPRWLCVAIGTSSRIRSSRRLEAGLGEPLGGAAADQSLAQGHALMPMASTPTMRRDVSAVAAAIPTSETISCVESLLTGVVRRTGQRAVMRASARRALWRSTMCRAMCSASVSTWSASPLPTTASIASSKSSGKRDMWTPFCSWARSTVHSISAAITVARPSWLTWIAFCTPVTPARVEGEPHLRERGLEIVVEVADLHRGYASSAVPGDFASLVSLACHDLRTPLATVSGFAKTLTRLDSFDDGKAARYLELIDAGSNELVELLELLSLAARIENGRYSPITREIDSLELARTAVPDATGEGETVEVDVDAMRRAIASLALAAHRHGGVEVAVTVAGTEVAVAPVVAAAAPVVLGEQMKDLGAAVGVLAVRAVGGQVELDGERLLVTLPRQVADSN